jgi:hypothetical protein
MWPAGRTLPTPSLNRRLEYDFDFASDDVPVVVAVVVGESENNDFYCACEKGTLFPQKNMENKGKEGRNAIPIITQNIKQSENGKEKHSEIKYLLTKIVLLLWTGLAPFNKRILIKVFF